MRPQARSQGDAEGRGAVIIMADGRKLKAVLAKPASAKGNYIQAVTLAASMLPGIPLEAATYTKASA